MGGESNVRWERYPLVAQSTTASAWLQIQANLGLAANTIEAYGRAVQDYLAFSARRFPDGGAERTTREHIAAYVRDLTTRPNPRAAKIVVLDSGAGLANATLQQRLTAIRLYYDYLIEEGARADNPVGRGRYTPGKGFGGQRDRGLVPRYRKLPWIPSEDEWLAMLGAARLASPRNRLLLALAYDAALRREELCSLTVADIDPAHRMARVRAETTKGRQERAVPYSAATGELYAAYLHERRALSRERGPLFLSESRRNRAQPITTSTWSKALTEIARRAGVPRFTTHTPRHLCLTDLARAGWDVHEMARFAGHRSVQTTLLYIHLSGRELAAKLERGMAGIHRVANANDGRGAAVSEAGTASHAARGSWRFTSTPATAEGSTWPVDLAAHDRSGELTPAEREGLATVVTRRGGNGHWPTGTRLEDLTADLLDDLRQGTTRRHLRNELYVLSRSLFGLGVTDRPPRKEFRIDPERDPTVGVASDWVDWCRRRLETSTLSPKVRQAYYYLSLKAGRWAATEHPEITEPTHWTRETAAAHVAAVDRMAVGQWAGTRYLGAQRIGKPLSAKAKLHHLAALSAFFRDAQEWGWLPRHFDPRRSFAVPRTIRALIGPNPRVLADDVWAKLLWAGLNLTDADLSRSHRSPAHYYPLPMVRTLAVVWLFAGLRSDEIYRLRVGCVRWQREDVSVAASDEVLPQQAVCLLDVPFHKTGTAFTKPVDPAVGEAVAAWEEARPGQPSLVDRKTGEAVQFLFAYRGARLGAGYLNGTLIPLLCRKAGIPNSDVRGDITSHRARSTIASQLFNAREPMSLFELQAWLGHRWPASTQHYALVAPTRLAKAYADAGYFARNVRAIELLIDRDAVESGAAAAGEPWKLYDLGHGYCTYDFFDRCPHRMACAKCAFFEPKTSARAQLIEGKVNLLRLRQEIPLLDDERAAVNDGVQALDALLERLADEPTPDGGPTPRERARLELPVFLAPPRP